MTSTFGEVSYSDDVFGGDKKTTNNKDLFLRLNEGDNEVRLVTSPFQYLVHKCKKDVNNAKDFGQKVGCSTLHGSCPLCDEGDKAKPRWFYGVIDRKTGTYKILDISFAVFSQIRKYARNAKHFGDPTKYDINILVDKNGGATGYYTVQPLSKEPLSSADQAIKEDADTDDLKRRCTPPTAEKVQERMDKIRGTTTAPSTASAAAKAPPAPAKAAAVSMTDDEELESTFPEFTDSDAT